MSKPNAFSEKALQRYAEQYPELDPSVIRECAEWVTSLGASAPDPSAVLAKRLRTKAEAARDALVAPRLPQRESTPDFAGFGPDGKAIRSHSPVDNAVTNYARWLVAEVHSQLLTPDDALALISRQDMAIQRAFGLSIAAWVGMDGIEHWRSAAASSSLAEAVRSWGGSYPWLRDANAWDRIVAAWSDRRAA